MNYSKAIFLISDEVRAVDVCYEPEREKKKVRHDSSMESGDRSYTFKTLDQTIAVDDYVVVQTDTRYGMTVCKVVGVDIEPDLEGSIMLKWIVAKVDKAAFDKVLRQEEEAIARIKSAEKRRKREALRESLLKDTNGDLKALPIYTHGKEDTGG